MYLKSVEAVGFKSFADKVEIGFNKDITAIVGPNGSGKSNITDAIRWVLGEQSTRYLRASSMQDVIFAGTQNRRGMNMAQVILTFDNSDKSLPLEFNEVEVGRRIYKSGESEYFINKKNCRLKDIYSLFMDTGVGKGSLFVIGQNKVDEILNGRAEEKRILIEDIAGIVRYKQRKHESLQRLEKISENLLRVSDIKIELENNIVGLKKDAEKTKEYNEVYKEFRHHHLILLAHNYQLYTKQLEQLQEKVQEYTNMQQEQMQQLELLELEQNRNNQETEEVQAEYAAINNELTEKVSLREQAGGQVKLLQERIKQSQDKLEELQKNIEKLSSELGKLKEQTIVQLREQESIQAAELDSLNTEYQTLQDEYEALLNEYSAANQEHTELQTLRNAKMGEYLDSKNKLEYLKKDILQLQGRIELLQKEKNSETGKLQTLQTELQELLKHLDTLHAHDAALKADINALNADKNSLLQNIQQQLGNLEVLNKSFAKLNNELVVLERLQTSYQGFGSGIRSVLTAKESWHSGVIGAVAEVISVPEKYILAIETALGNSMQNIITENEQVAKQAVQYLKNGKLGRATFLPKTSIRGSELKETEILKEAGVLGTAESIVDVRADLSHIIKFLLGRVVVADNIDNALTIARKYGYRYRIVTLEGEVLNVGGSLTGGTNSNTQPGFLAREEEIKRHKSNLAELDSKKQALEAHIASLKNEDEQLAQKLAAKQSELQNNMLEITKFSGQNQHLQENLDRQNNQLKRMEQDIAQHQADVLSAEQAIVLAEQSLVALEASKDAHEQDIALVANKLGRIQSDKDSKQDAVNKVYTKLAGIRQSMDYIREKLQNATESMENIQAQSAELTQQIDRNEIYKLQLREDLEQVQQDETELTSKVQELRDRLVVITKKRDNLLSLQIELQTKLREQNSVQTSTDRSLSRYQSQVGERQLQIHSSLQAMQERYDATLEEAQEILEQGFDIKESKVMTETLKEKIQSLGLINPKAIQDYEQALQKVEFLTKQYNDLNEGKEHLDKIIEEINKSMIEKFKAAFNELNIHFNNTYQSLFGGGQARLEMVEENDWLNSGIDIYVQPHGKKVQSLSALSGGERSLTVIALLFAILSMKKTAFCVLDEIDAPLDEANINRFKDFLVRYGEATQFIMVTHRKSTMQIASTLYGVTMQEAGVSKVLSVHIKDVEEMKL